MPINLLVDWLIARSSTLLCQYYEYVIMALDFSLLLLLLLLLL